MKASNGTQLKRHQVQERREPQGQEASADKGGEYTILGDHWAQEAVQST